MPVQQAVRLHLGDARMLLVKTYLDLKRSRVRCLRPGVLRTFDVIDLSLVSHIEVGLIRWTMKELTRQYNGKSVRYVPLAACRCTASELLALQGVVLPSERRPNPYPAWVLQTDECEEEEFGGRPIGVPATPSAMAGVDKAKVKDMTLAAVAQREGKLTSVDYLRMFKPSNPSASWYAVARMEIKKEKQKVGTAVPASPVVCPVQMGVDDDGSWVEA